MTDFNNNINKFRPIEKLVDVKITKTSGEQKAEEKEVVQEQTPKFVQDTGVLGRSQIKQPKEVGIAKSVDEAVSLAMNKSGFKGRSSGEIENPLINQSLSY